MLESHRLDVGLSTLVVFGSSDVEPILDDGEADYGPALLEQHLDQLGHIEALPWWNAAEDRRLEQIDACVDQEPLGRFFLQGLYLGALALHHAVGDRQVVLADGDRRVR